ncbi:MAG: DUF3833 family protein [Rhodobacteraceae bacterium]|nr:DUF3833 family protein [Paracoccaceae bacterium]
MRFLALSVFLFLAACSGRPSLDQDKLSDREFNLEEFFEGKTVAHGQFKDILGRVQRRFTVDIDGTWDGNTLTLIEDFTYADNTTEQRIWTLTKTGDETWSGTAPGVIGTATGTESGDTFNWAYKIDLPVKDGTLRVSFDDWMWLLTENRVLNIAYMKRFGITVGEVIITFEKLD